MYCAGTTSVAGSQNALRSDRNGPVPDQTGRLLEIVEVADEPVRIIHADVLRAEFYDYL